MSPGSRNNECNEAWRLAAKKDNLELRATIIQAIRGFFAKRGYLEVETPYLIPAPIPEAHIDPIEAEGALLHTSPEACMKRLLAAGYPKLFQICKCFRKGERGDLHLPEFTLLEWYRRGTDYMGIMEECEELIWEIFTLLSQGDYLEYQGGKISLQRPWDRLSVRAAFDLYASCPLEVALNRGLFDEILAREIEPSLGVKKPLFLYDYPAEFAALSRIKQGDSRTAERVELYIGGLELANGFTELTDTKEQRRRFERELSLREELGKPLYHFPEKFLASLSSMPDSAGIALGVDRLVMLLADSTDIREVVTFTPEEL